MIGETKEQWKRAGFPPPLKAEVFFPENTIKGGVMNPISRITEHKRENCTHDREIIYKITEGGKNYVHTGWFLKMYTQFTL